MRGFPRGFQQGTRRYGLLLSHFEPAIVDGLVYMKTIPFGAPPNAKGPPPKIVFQLLTRLVPSFRKRIALSHRAFEERFWREDLRRWDEEVKPACIAAHTALEAVDVAALDDEALILHLERCLAHCEKMIEQHHVFTMPCTAPIGDLLAHVQEWTGKSVGEILRALRGSSPISNGAAAGELAALADALKGDAPARAAFESAASPAAALSALETSADPVGATARRYLGKARNRCLGYDLGSKTGGEMPEILVRAIRAALDGAGASASDSEAATRAIRDAVPAEHRARFDELLVEARLMNRLRDERGHYCDNWAISLGRVAVMEAGRRLVAKGKLTESDDAADATLEEITALLRGGTTPSAETVHARAVFRGSRTVSDPDVPPWLGAPPSGPPPAEWLPAHGRRAQRAIVTFIGSLFTEPELRRTATTVHGLPVSPGVYVGRARVVNDEADFGRIEKGDVLVTRATSPYFNVVLPLLGALVTDRGGQLCHAAIVSREYGIPGVVGTREATKMVRDGARVRVDGDQGVVEVLP
jgi:pyruvate,water dikinase